MSASDRYDYAEAQIKAFTRSGVRAKIMLSLKDGYKTAAEMEDLIGIRSTTILHTLKEMSEANLVRRSANGYALTNIGKIEALLLDDLVSSIAALDEHKNFWLTHDTSGIPIDLQKKIGMLSRSETIEADPGALLKTVEHFINELNKSWTIYGISPIIIPGYADVIWSAVNRGAEVQLILTESIIKIVLSDHEELLKQLLLKENFKLYSIGDDIKVAFTVTESLLNFGLFRLDGGYDLGTDLICMGESAVVWGRELFGHYRRISKRIEGIRDIEHSWS